MSQTTKKHGRERVKHTSTHSPISKKIVHAYLKYTQILYKHTHTHTFHDINGFILELYFSNAW